MSCEHLTCPSPIYEKGSGERRGREAVSLASGSPSPPQVSSLKRHHAVAFPWEEILNSPGSCEVDSV